MSNLVEVFTVNLTGAALDWAVGKADGLDVRNAGPSVWVKGKIPFAGTSDDYYNPTVDWRIGGPLVEKLLKTGQWEIVQGIETGCVAVQNYTDECIPVDGQTWCHQSMRFESDSLLVAACRALVAAKLDVVVQVPQELIQ